MKECLEKYHLVINKMTIQNQEKVLSTDQGQFVIVKKVRKDLPSIYRYLESRDFLYFLLPINSIQEDDYEIYPWKENTFLPLGEQATELIYVLSLLHTKTTFYETVELDDIKKIYEDMKKKLTELETYYQELQDMIEMHIFMAPSEYFLVRNISRIYMAIYFCQRELETWYEIMMKKRKKRVVLLHGSPTLSHFQVEGSKLSHWNAARRDSPIYDLLIFYKAHYQSIDFASLLHLYESRYPLLPEEKSLFFLLLSIPPRIRLEKDEYKKCEEIERYLEYLNKSSELLSEQYKEPATK